MPFGRIDDGLCTNKKFRHLLSMKGGSAALGLWTVADSWCNKELTDGQVPDFMVSGLGPWTQVHADLLVTARLWTKADGGYQFHDWEDFNDTKAEVLAKRAKEAEKKGNQRSAKRAKKALSRNMSPGDTPGDNPRESPPKSPPSPSAPTSDIRHPLPATQVVGRGRERPQTPLPDDPPDTAFADTVKLSALVRVRFSEAHAQKRGGPPTWPKASLDQCEVIAAWLEPKGETGADYERLLAKMLPNFFADARAEAAGFPIAFLAADADRHLNPPKARAPVKAQQTSFTPPAPASAFTGVEVDLDEIYGPLKKPREVSNG